MNSEIALLLYHDCILFLIRYIESFVFDMCQAFELYAWYALCFCFCFCFCFEYDAIQRIRVDVCNRAIDVTRMGWYFSRCTQLCLMLSPHSVISVLTMAFMIFWLGNKITWFLEMSRYPIVLVVVPYNIDDTCWWLDDFFFFFDKK